MAIYSIGTCPQRCVIRTADARDYRDAMSRSERVCSPGRVLSSVATASPVPPLVSSSLRVEATRACLPPAAHDGLADVLTFPRNSITNPERK